MRRVARFPGMSPEQLLELEGTDRFETYKQVHNLAGYVLEQRVASPLPGGMMARSCLVIARIHVAWITRSEPTMNVGKDADSLRTAVLTHPAFLERGINVPTQPRPSGAPYRMVQLRAGGRLVPLAVPPKRLLKDSLAPVARQARGEADTAQQQLANAITLRPVQSGQSYRITSPAVRGLVRPELAEALETVFERFAHKQGFTPEKPLEISLSRGFKAGSPGHGEGRAVDIAAVGGKSFLEWKQEWDQAITAAEKLPDAEQQAESITAERKSNLGYWLYKALQEHGGWRVDPKGWRPYRGVMQLFGPWTAAEGPWKAMQIKDPNPHQRERLADQLWVFRAHQDHIHVAR